MSEHTRRVNRTRVQTLVLVLGAAVLVAAIVTWILNVLDMSGAVQGVAVGVTAIVIGFLDREVQSPTKRALLRVVMAVLGVFLLVLVAVSLVRHDAGIGYTILGIATGVLAIIVAVVPTRKKGRDSSVKPAG